MFAAVCAAALLAATQPGPDFRDIGKQAGLTASFPNGGDKSKQYIIETALPQIAHWLGERAKLTQLGSDSLAFFYDYQTKEFTPQQATHLEPLRHH